MVRDVREYELSGLGSVHARPEALDAPGSEAPGSGDEVITEPVRAWLIRAADDTARGEDRAPSPDDDGFLWRMFLEGGRDTVDLGGTFEDLVARAVSARVVEFHVWSRSQRTYLPFSPMTVRVPD